MAIRFRIRSILILTTIAAVGMSIVAKPVFDNRTEERLLEKLFPPLPANQSPFAISSAQSIPPQLQESPLRRFHKDETLERVTFLVVPKIDHEILRDICGFQYLTHLNLNGTTLTNEQTMRLAANLPNLRIIDCESTKVDYKTLLEMQRKHPRMCHLAHRHAAANLRRSHGNIYPDFSLAPPNGGTPRHVHVRLNRVTDSNAINAVKHLYRPISTLSISHGHKINTAFIKRLCDARSDFDISLNITPTSQNGPKAFSIYRFQNVAHPRVKWLSLANIRLDDDYRVPSERAFEVVQFQSCAANVVEAFVDTDVRVMQVHDMELPIDRSTIPSSVKSLGGLVNCDVSTVELSHCYKLTEINLGSSTNPRPTVINLRSSNDFLKSLLTAPNLKEVQLTAGANEDVPHAIEDAYRKRGVTLNIKRSSLHSF